MSWLSGSSVASFSTQLAAAKESAGQRLLEAKAVAEQQAALVKEKAKALEQELIFPACPDRSWSPR